MWNTFTFMSDIFAHRVKLKALSVYTAYNNGFVELEFYGIKLGKLHTTSMKTSKKEIYRI